MYICMCSVLINVCAICLSNLNLASKAVGLN